VFWVPPGNEVVVIETEAKEATVMLSDFVAVIELASET
jgi:hypothetical protein